MHGRDEELKELWDWRMKENERVNRDYSFSGMHDGPHAAEMRKVAEEYQRRFHEINNKYSKE